MYKDKSAVVAYPLWAMGTFAALMIVLTVAESFVIHACLARSLGQLVALGAVVEPFDVVPALLIGVALAGVSVLIYFLKTVRVVNR
jgi:hypothetical protein